LVEQMQDLRLERKHVDWRRDIRRRSRARRAAALKVQASTSLRGFHQQACVATFARDLRVRKFSHATSFGVSLVTETAGFHLKFALTSFSAVLRFHKYFISQCTNQCGVAFVQNMSSSCCMPSLRCCTCCTYYMLSVCSKYSILSYPGRLR
jgi:hypothetical protein